MIDILKSEYIKSKRTFIKKLIILAPIVTILAAMCTQWKYILQETYNLWPAIFLPIIIALFTSLTSMQEKKAGNYRNLLIHNISPARIWIAKIINLAINLLFSCFILIILLLADFFILLHGKNIPLPKVILCPFYIWITSLTLIPIQLWASTWKGTLLSMAVGFIGIPAGVIAASKPYWMFIPWSYPTRIMCPILGIGPNALPLKAGDTLTYPVVVSSGLALSMMTFLIFTLITALWFTKREVK